MRLAFKRLDQELPERFGRAMRWVRHPNSRWVRLPAGLMLIVGGIFSIMPGLGLWMLPLGLLLLAQDVPLLRKPVGHSTIWSADKWAAFRPHLKDWWARTFRTSGNGG